MRAMSLGRLKLSSCQRRLLLLEGNHIIVGSQWGLGTSGSPREETRLLGRLCVELAGELAVYMSATYTTQ